MKHILMRRTKYHSVGIDGSTTKELHTLRFFVRPVRVWQLTNQILRGGCNGERSSQVVQ